MNFRKIAKIIPHIPRLTGTFLDNFRVHKSGGGPRKGPLGIVWEINNKCDARCVYCNYWNNSTIRAEPELATKEKIEIIKRLAKADVCFLSFCNGEPLLTHEICDLIAAAKKNNLLVNVSTNGSHIEEVAPQLIEAGLDFLTISIESHLPEVHDNISGYKGLFTKIERGIAALKKAGGRKRPYLIARKLIDKRTIDQLDDFIRHWERQVDEIIFKPIMHNPKASFVIPAGMGFSMEDKTKTTRLIHDLLKKRRRFNTEYHRRIPDYFFSGGSLNKRYPCFAGVFCGDIDFRGNLYPCIDGTASIGNLTAEDFMALWASPKMGAFRREFKIGRSCDCWSDRFASNILIQNILNLLELKRS